LGELSSLMNMEKINEKQIEEIAQVAIQKGFCELLVVSMGEKGAMLATKNEIHRVIPPSVKRLSTVGAGDSLVA